MGREVLTGREAGNVAGQAPLDRYCLPDDYVANLTPSTRDDISGGEYWSRRVAAGAVYQFPVYRTALRVARERNAASIMDVGCGLGQKLRYIHDHAPDIHITGLDQESAIKYCRREHTFGEWHAVDLDRPINMSTRRKADLIICADVIEHVLDPDRLMDHLRHYAATGAIIVLSTPARERLRGADCRSSPNPHHIREWSTTELRNYVERRGFRIIKQVHAVPVRLGLNRPLLAEVLSSMKRRRTIRYNQICLLAP